MRKQAVYLLKGLPASGKSTWAKQKIEEDRHNGIITKRVNKDDLRAMMDNSVHSKEREKFILEVRDNLISLALTEGYNVIVDDTNFASKHRKQVESIVQKLRSDLSANIEFIEKIFDTPLQECIERDSKREKSVGRKVIIDMYNRYLRDTERATIGHDSNLPDCVVVDVDGTLALKGDRNPFDYASAINDKLNKPVVDLLSNLQHSLGVDRDLKTFIMTGRENKPLNTGDVKQLTKDWLHKHNVSYTDIFIREHKDVRPDWQVKEELYRQNIEGRYNVLYWIDDRKQVIDHIRTLGITVLDVAGNEF